MYIMTGSGHALFSPDWSVTRCHELLLQFCNLLSGAFNVDALFCQSDFGGLLVPPLNRAGVAHFLFVLIGKAVARMPFRDVSSKLC